MLHAFDTDHSNRLLKLSYGAASPLWAPFVLAAGMGAGFWMLSQWTRQSLAAHLPGAASAPSPAPTPAMMPEPTPAAETLVEIAPRPAPEPVAPIAYVAPADPVDAPHAPLADREPEAAVGRMALMSETSAAALGEMASFGGDVRADEAVEPTPTAEIDDGADLVDAAYAENFGPVPAPGGQMRSRKRRLPPGTAPGA